MNESHLYVVKITAIVVIMSHLPDKGDLIGLQVVSMFRFFIQMCLSGACVLSIVSY